jgi:hypothetical protein
MTFKIRHKTMEEFVGDAIKITMANRQLFTWHHVQNAHDAMVHYWKAKGISFVSFSDSSDIEVESD